MNHAPSGSRRPEALIAAALGVGSLALYLRTLAPSVATIFDDSLEFQLVGPTLGIAHPTGYPLYTLLGWLFSRLPLGDAAYRMNLLSAVGAAAAVAMLCLCAQEWTGNRLAAAVGSVLFALSPVFWSQATIAEVYTLHAFFVSFILWATLRADRPAAHPDEENASRWLLPVLGLGLSLTHHRMTLLLLPAVVLFALWTSPSLLRRPRRWPSLALAFSAPLLLYLYIPLRGLTVTSLDGTYRNTWDGFWNWVTASDYGIFLRGNPLAVHYTPRFYGELLLAQFGWVGTLLAVLGLLTALRRPRRGALLVLAFLIHLAFALAYRAADIEVFFIPAFLLGAIFAAAGMALLVDALARRFPPRGARERAPLLIGQGLLVVASLAQPIVMTEARWPQLDRSDAWDVYDYGKDMLSQPLPQGATVVGILGEMTLWRYFQRTEGLRPDVVTVAADAESARLAAVQQALDAGRAVYLTRPLAGAPERYSLSAVGPLIRVWPKGEATLPLPTRQVGFAFLGGTVRWVGYDLTWRHVHRGTVARVSLWWKARSAPAADYKVSVRLLDDAGQTLAQTDDVPVHNTYPTSAWQAGETVLDGYDLPLPRGASAPRRLLVILYQPADGSEVGRAEVDLDRP
jgi:hypothetical protein